MSSNLKSARDVVDLCLNNWYHICQIVTLFLSVIRYTLMIEEIDLDVKFKHVNNLVQSFKK